MLNALITTVPFGERDPTPIELLKNSDISFKFNPLNRKLTERELIELVGEFDILIAGTEKITQNVLNAGTRLKLISRVGIGLDGIDLEAAKSRGILISYTPDAPAPAVSELTIGLVISLLRKVHVANSELHALNWTRHFGKRIPNVVFGIIGLGRIGSKVLEMLLALGAKKILVNDLDKRPLGYPLGAVEWTSKDKIYTESDLITLHLPLNVKTKNMITRSEIMIMKSDALLINTSRGGLINENDLYDCLNEGRLGGVALDVFEQEPYDGPLSKIERCLMTSHMGSMSIDCRAAMEIEATEEAIRFACGLPLKNLIPNY